MIRPFTIRLLAGILATVHALVLTSLCACATEEEPTGALAGSSCHQTSTSLRVSNLEACCCEDQANIPESPGLATSVNQDAAATSMPSAALMAIPPPTRVRFRVGIRQRGSSPPRPPLRV